MFNYYICSMKDQTTKRCSKCTLDKNIDEFNKNVCRKDGLSLYCKLCCVIITLECRRRSKEGISYNRVNDYIVNSPEYHRDAFLRNKYNITLKQYNELHKLQNGKCRICDRSQDTLGKALNVDHDHKTNRVRGLLCNNCNRGLGHFMDDKDILTRALEYLSN